MDNSLGSVKTQDLRRQRGRCLRISDDLACDSRIVSSSGGKSVCRRLLRRNWPAVTCIESNATDVFVNFSAHCIAYLVAEQLRVVCAAWTIWYHSELNYRSLR